MPKHLDNLVDLLDLEEIDRDLYRGLNDTTATKRTTLFGGQVAAQCLRAAGATVPDDRYPHSLHGYFLRPGMVDRPVILQVDRDRDGRSFSARHVVAIQAGEEIFTLTASFKVDETSPVIEPPQPQVTEPEALAPNPHPYHSMFDLRTLPGSSGAEVWAKALAPLPDDRLVQACALTYLSDTTSGFADVRGDLLPHGGPSIDHAMWFHDPIRVDDWILVRKHPVVAGGGRGLYTGLMHSRDGRLGAVVNQEMLLRAPAPTPAP